MKLGEHSMSNKQKRLNMIRLPGVCARVSLSKPTIYRLMKNGKFPKNKKIGERATAWIEEEIDDWIITREAAC
jgi:prophage regulatory protein